MEDKRPVRRPLAPVKSLVEGEVAEESQGGRQGTDAFPFGALPGSAASMVEQRTLAMSRRVSGLVEDGQRI